MLFWNWTGSFLHDDPDKNWNRILAFGACRTRSFRLMSPNQQLRNWHCSFCAIALNLIYIGVYFRNVGTSRRLSSLHHYSLNWRFFRNSTTYITWVHPFPWSILMDMDKETRLFFMFSALPINSGSYTDSTDWSSHRRQILHSVPGCWVCLSDKHGTPYWKGRRYIWTGRFWLLSCSVMSEWNHSHESSLHFHWRRRWRRLTLQKDGNTADILG